MQSRAGIVAMGVALAVLSAAPAAAAKKRADLYVVKVSEPPPALAVGGTLTASDKVKNRRATAKRSSTVFLLSSDEFRDRSDTVLGSRSVRKLKPGKSSRGTVDFTVPAAVPTGSYRLLACADAANRVRERSETNNCRASKQAVQVRGLAAPDRTPPATPSITDTDPNPPANDNDPEVKGSGAETGSTVRIYATADCSGAPIGSGPAAAFNAGPGVTASVPNDQITNLRATATDAAGNVSGCSAPFAYTENSDLPPAPAISGTTPPPPSNDNQPEVTGSAEAGSTVRIYSTGDCSGAPLVTGTAAAFAGAGLTVTVPSNAVTQLRATATDSAANTSACSNPFAYTEDSIAPAVPSITDTDPDSPSVDITPQVKGTADPGSTVRIYTSANCSGTAAIGSAASFASPGITVTVPANQPTNLTATATDTAGNVSGCSNPFPYTQDSTAPSAPSVTGTAPASPSNDNQPEVQGTAQAGSLVRIYPTGNCSGTALASGSAATFANPGITVSVAADATTTLTATAADAGGTSGCSNSQSYLEDSTPPPPPSITDTNPDSPADDTNPEVTGSAEAGSTVSVHGSGDCTGTALATGSAALFAAPGFTVTVPDGAVTTLTANATDAAGNGSTCSAPFVYTEAASP